MASGLDAGLVAKQLFCSAASVGIATTCTNPIDVVKVRLQLARTLDGVSPGLVKTGHRLIQTEGVGALVKGLTPALVRAGTYGGMRLGLYTPCKALVGSNNHPSVHRKVAAGCLSGSIAAFAANPTDLVKVRLQMKAPDGQAAYRGTWDVVRHVVRQEGVAGLWKGAVPSMIRAATLTASQCATYDEVKQALIRSGASGNDLSTHLTASMFTGIVTTTATSPVDVIKTMMFAGGTETKGRGVMHVATHIFQREGVHGFFKGWTANYARLGPQTAITFVALEKLRLFVGLAGV
mmetsp:Transcript_27361/g.87668  ORF Transcript_27361/g.87668 Transcript_27361/m.87668 type:complete len:292 (-) Transcript_27361:170-1045(-)